MAAIVVAFQAAIWALQNETWARLRALSNDGAVWHKRLDYAKDQPDGKIISVTLTLGGTTYLYFGFLLEYELTETGDLKYLVLRAAARRDMANPIEEAYQLPGEYFIVNCKNVHTVDIDYIWVSQEDIQDIPEDDGEVEDRVDLIESEVEGGSG